MIQPARTLAGVLTVLLVAGLAAEGDAPGKFSISGRITGLAGSDRALVVVEGLRRLEATTRVRGLWRVEGVPPGEYTVTPHHGRYTFSPPHRRLVVRDRDLQQIDFQANLAVLSAPPSTLRGPRGDTGTATPSGADPKRPTGGLEGGCRHGNRQGR